MKRWPIVISIFVIFCTSICVAEESNDEKVLRSITQEELKRIIEKHQDWLSVYDTPEKRKTSEALNDLRRANLSKVDLIEVDLSNANLVGANLSGAKLWGTNLSNSELRGANLANAELWEADLSHADLQDANLNHANLMQMGLSNANLLNVDLSDTFLWEAYLTGVNFEPSVLPPVDNIAGAVDLHTMIFRESPQPLVKLRKAFKEAGYRQQEQAITHAINQSGLWRDKSYFGRVEDAFKYVFFNLPTQWGMYPGRALRILLAGILVFMVFYLVALQAPESEAGIWKIRGEERILDEDKKDKELIQPGGFWSVLGTAFYFSLLSAFHIGWRDLNVGSWISRLQGKEYTLRATGWVRRTSGIQSLISVYLLAMWVLTYFGRPFG